MVYSEAASWSQQESKQQVGSLTDEEPKGQPEGFSIRCDDQRIMLKGEGSLGTLG